MNETDAADAAATAGAPNGRLRVRVVGPWMISRHNESAPQIAYIVHGDEHDEVAVVYSADPGSARYAAAVLIAAAPDLLYAAQHALNFIENTESDMGITLYSGDFLRNAIAKAKGEA